MAEAQAQQAAGRDSDASALLSAQVQVERYSGPRETALARAVEGIVGPIYDPLDLYCRLAREFGWSHREMEALDYVCFFGYVDRLSAQQRKESARVPGVNLPAGYIEAETAAQAAQIATAPRLYEGRTVPYHGG